MRLTQKSRSPSHAPDLANSARPLPIARNQSDTITSDAPSRVETGCSADVYAPLYAPLYASPQSEVAARIQDHPAQLITCRVSELRKHPSYIRHRLALQPVKMSALQGLGDLPFHHPLLITRDRIIIDGYARWELAKRRDRETLQCLEIDITPEEALQLFIQTHRRFEGLNDFVRIELALDLEPDFQKKAKLNQQAGGKAKGLSKLTVAEQVDSRREIARVAGVSPGNVRKVKRILAEACSPVKEAARRREISINRAEKWSRQTQAEQTQLLRRHRIERTLRKAARQIVAKQLAAVPPPRTKDTGLDIASLARFAVELASPGENSTDLRSTEIEVSVVDAPGKSIFVTQELMQWRAQIKSWVNIQ